MTDLADTRASAPLTGRKVLAIAVAAFGTIIAANLTLAYSAIESFPGVEVKNGYIASQSFEADRAAQERLGWRSTAAYAGGELLVDVRDRTGAAAPLRDVAFRIGRPTTRSEALEMTRAPDGRGWRAMINLAPGPWRLDLVGAGPGDVRFRQHLTVEGAR